MMEDKIIFGYVSHFMAYPCVTFIKPYSEELIKVGWIDMVL